jgi:AhpD family alkylhydroperoxidase
LEDLSHAVFADGALSKKTNQLITASVAHVTQCPITSAAHSAGPPRGPPEEIMEAI